MKIYIDIKQIFRMAWQGPVIIFLAVILGFVSNTIRSNPIPVIGDWSTEGRLSTENGEQLSIPLEEARILFQQKSAVFIDARDASQYEEGHIQGALNLPWHDVDELFMDVIEDIFEDTVIITYCDGETCSLSHDLALFLREMGFPNVKVLVNGWTVWVENSLPVVKKENAADHE